MPEFFDPIGGKSKPIQGLRALAVLSVFIFHLDSNWLPGGFLGVDIFFVISGLLIARILFKDIEANGSVRLKNFYAKRFYRIVPTAVTVVILSLPLAYFSLLPSDMRDFSASVVGVVTLSLNKMIANNIGYFSPIAETQPLLHFWSLMVEIHFYLLIPLLFYFFRQKGLIIFAIFGLIGASLIYADSLSSWDPKNSYYLLPSRAWELLLGVSLFIILKSTTHLGFSARLAALFQPLSMVVLFASLWIFDSSVRHPGFLSLIPVVATVALLWSVLLYPSGIVARLLSVRWFVFFGNISFSFYLWHYIFIVVFKAETGDLNYLDMIKVCFWTIMCSLVTYFGIEKYCFNYNRYSFNSIRDRFSVVGGCILIVAFGVYGFISNGYESAWLYKQPDTVKTAYLLTKRASNFESYDEQADCIFRVESFDDSLRPQINRCSLKFGKGILVLGDSHAIGVWRLIKRIRENSNDDARFVVGISKGGCKPYKKTPGCTFDIYAEQAEYFANHFAQVFYVQAGSSLVWDEHPNTAHIDKVVEFLENLALFMDTIWIGPRIEPNIDLRNFIRSGCDASIEPDFGHKSRLVMLNSVLNERLSYSKVRYISSTLLDVNTFGSCDRLFWRDTNHWSPSALDQLALSEDVKSIFIGENQKNGF